MYLFIMSNCNNCPHPYHVHIVTAVATLLSDREGRICPLHDSPILSLHLGEEDRLIDCDVDMRILTSVFCGLRRSPNGTTRQATEHTTSMISPSLVKTGNLCMDNREMTSLLNTSSPPSRILYLSVCAVHRGIHVSFSVTPPSP